MLARFEKYLNEAKALAAEVSTQMTKEEAKAYWSKLAQNLPEAEREVVLKALDNEGFQKGVIEGTLRQDEFSKNMDALRVEKETLNKWYQEDALPTYQTNLEGVKKLKAYQDRYGDLSDDNPPANPGGNGTGGLTRKDLDEALRARDQAYVSLQKTLNKVSLDHYHRFHEPLDPDALEKFALDGKYSSLSEAYSNFIAPRLEEQKRKADEVKEQEWQKKLAEAEAKGAMEYASKHHLPLPDSKSTEFHPFFDRPVPKEGESAADIERNAQNSFLDGLRETAPQRT